ncbi:hypothetical protein ACTXT7_013151 [Hymenolepis weldensis]
MPVAKFSESWKQVIRLHRNIANEIKNLHIKCDDGINQQKFSEHNSVNRILLKDLPFVPFSQYISQLCNLCSIRDHKETMCKVKLEFRNESVTQKVKPMAIQVTESIASLKQDVKWNENPQKNPLERTASRTGSYYSHWIEISIESDAVIKTESRDLPSKSKTSAMFCFRHLYCTPRTKRKKRMGTTKKGTEPC